MSFSLVGSLGTVASAAVDTAVTPSYGQSPTAGNLLICWVSGTGINTQPGTPSGWTAVHAGSTAGGGTSSGVFAILSAAGGDAAPTIAAIAGMTWNAVMLGEFHPSGAAAVVDQVGNHGVTTGTTPHVATAGGVDTAVGDLMVTCMAILYSVAAVDTITDTYNNVASPTIVNNNLTVTTNHYDLGYGTTTSKAAADSDSVAVTTTNEDAAQLVVVSFYSAPLAGVPPVRATRGVRPPVQQVVQSRAKVRAAPPTGENTYRAQTIVAKTGVELTVASHARITRTLAPIPGTPPQQHKVSTVRVPVQQTVRSEGVVTRGPVTAGIVHPPAHPIVTRPVVRFVASYARITRGTNVAKGQTTFYAHPTRTRPLVRFVRTVATVFPRAALLFAPVPPTPAPSGGLIDGGGRGESIPPDLSETIPPTEDPFL